MKYRHIYLVGHCTGAKHNKPRIDCAKWENRDFLSPEMYSCITTVRAHNKREAIREFKEHPQHCRHN